MSSNNQAVTVEEESLEFTNCTCEKLCMCSRKEDKFAKPSDAEDDWSLVSGDEED